MLVDPCPAAAAGPLRGRWALVLLCGLIGACAAARLPAPDLPQTAPAQWQARVPAQVGQAPAALPHGGSLAQLLDWWRQQGDPLLVELIAAGQQVSPTVASAGARLAQARAVRVAAGADLAPSLDVAGNVSRSRRLMIPGQPALNSASSQLGLQTAWELDVFGGLDAARQAAGQRLLGAQADWHEARVSVAAEVAVQYDLWRQCRQLAGIARREADSRAQTARLAERSSQAGLSAPAEAALAAAAAAQAQDRALAQAAQCELELKALVALTGWAEPQLRGRLLALPEVPAQTLPALALNPVPAQALAQRPDLFSAERALLAARADIAAADAQRLPRLSLGGFVGVAGMRVAGSQTDATTWSLGPLALSLPLLDSGRRTAQVDAAQARYQEAAAQYAARVRQAVREVESALVQLQSTAERGPPVQAALAAYRSALQATASREQAGLASQFELEDARRQLLAAEIAQAQWQTQVRAAQVSLYRAVGGGWSPALLAQAAPALESAGTR
jgi:multidrug efflux system outer membrane protein